MVCSAMVCSLSVASCRSAFLSVLLLVLLITMTTGEIRQNETPCLSEGGICVAKESCDAANRVNKTELCPEQEKDGAVCCNKVPEGVPCREKGGLCRKECHNVQNFGQLDCDEGSSCCLLIF